MNEIIIKLYGIIATDWGNKIIKIPIDEEEDVINLISILKKVEMTIGDTIWNHFDKDFTPKRGTLILINGIDFNVMEGLNTLLKENDEVSLIPTISGG